MFLDDKLYTQFTSRKIESSRDAEKMLNELYAICDEHKMKALSIPNISDLEIKAEINRIFNSWDSFIDRIKEEKRLLTPLFEEFSYKFSWMQNPELKRIYQSL